MLRITPSESANAAKHYFGQSLSRGDYYFEGQEVAGVWGGLGAKQLGLEGNVGHADFLALVDNFLPNGQQLTARMAANRRPGYDFTFDAPKSVSLLHALTRDERIPAAMREAVLETMRELEEEMHTRVRKNGAFEDRKTGKMIWADFTHFTSRPASLNPELEAELLKGRPWLNRFRDKKGNLYIPDPHLHMHVYAINATFDPAEGIWKAGEFFRIKRDACYYQAAYHTRLAAKLQGLGYQVEARPKFFEIAGVPRDVVSLFSRRTQEVEEAAKRLGISSPEAKARLGALTRHRKNGDFSLSELRQLWKGFLPSERTESLKRIADAALASPSPRALDLPEAARAGIDYALLRELERVSEVSKRRLIGSALEHSIGKASVKSVEAAFAATPTIIAAKVGDEDRVTTREVLREERRLIELVQRTRATVRPLVGGAYAFKNPLFAQLSDSTAEQRKAIEHVFASQDWVVGIIGRAGTGKTTLLKEIADGLEAKDRKLVVCAPAAEASRGVLRAEGFQGAETLKALLSDTKAVAKLSGAVLWIDEAGMLGTQDLLAALTLAKSAGASKVVLSGDPSQIRSVPRGDALRLLETEAGLSVARLEAIKRQKNPELKAAVEAISKGNVLKGISTLEKSGAIFEGKPEDAHAQLAEAYSKAIKAKQSVLVVSPRHSEGDALTRSIRGKLQAEGLLSTQERTLPRTVNLAWTQAERSSVASYEPGLLVQFKEKATGFLKGERGRVKAVDVVSGRVDVLKNNGEIVGLPLEAAKNFQVYRVEEITVALGDKLRITENGTDAEGKHRFNNGTTVEVKGFTASGDIETMQGHVLPSYFGNLAHGYVITADSAQAKTVDVVLAGISQDSMDATDMRRFYVTVSRARHSAQVFTDDKSALLAAASRDSVRRSATEIERQRQFLASQKAWEAGRAKPVAIEQTKTMEPKAHSNTEGLTL